MSVIKFLLSSIFIDGVWVHKYWHCHRLPHRSFKLDGRQFHVCSRCTGLIMGAPFGVILVGVGFSFWYWFIPAITVFLVDGLTQLWGWRTSNNFIRFLSGFTVSLFFFTFLIYIIRTI